CIDEPTSGLDSSSAQVVISCLRQVAHHHNICIISSIHQPTAEVFSLFDQVYMLAKGGVCVYSGPPSDIRQHLTKVSDRMDQDDIFPVEELIKYSCLSYEDSSVQDLVASSEVQILSQDLIVSEETTPVMDGIPTNRNRFSMKSAWVLMKRYTLYVRGYLWPILGLMYGLYLCFGLTLNILFDHNMIFTDGCVNLEDEFNSTCNQTQDKEDEDFHLEASFIYVCFGYGMFLFLVLVQSAIMFSKEIVFFCNEHRNGKKILQFSSKIMLLLLLSIYIKLGWYSTGAFYFMKIWVELLPQIPIFLIYAYLIDIYEPVRSGIYFSIAFYIILGATAVQSVGHLLSIVTLGEFVALVISIPGIEAIFLMVSNLGTPVKRLHYILQFISNFAPTRFGIEAMFLLQYGFDRCRPKEVQKILFKLKMENDEHEHHTSFLLYTFIMLIFNLLFYRLISLLLLVIKSNHYDHRRKRAQKIANFHKNLQPSNVIIPGLQC
ncbi:hypothetical protein BLA29_005304, partial [Euroglyphus maynei]